MKYEEIRKNAEKQLQKRYKHIYSYVIESIDPHTFDRNGLRMFLQKDGTFSTATGFARKVFKTKFFARMYLKKYNNCRLVLRILYHSHKKDFEDFDEEVLV